MLTEEDLTSCGFRRVEDINPRPPHRKSYAYTNTSLFLTVRDGGIWDGCPMFEYSGGAVTIRSRDYLERLARLIDEGHGRVRN